MIEIRPSCEHCNRPLPPNATDARICSFECTFCSDCVELLSNVCPNCGGGFSARPIRPSRAWLPRSDLATYPASTQHKHRPVDLIAHAALVARLGALEPHER
ncbi:MAG TPA: DUF1272 domain-containing protein [Polyangiales bacterium]|nr:DUF1272 domain-containing protein [Polyangiales bacterium]